MGRIKRGGRYAVLPWCERCEKPLPDDADSAHLCFTMYIFDLNQLYGPFFPRPRTELDEDLDWHFVVGYLCSSCDVDWMTQNSGHMMRLSDVLDELERPYGLLQEWREFRWWNYELDDCARGAFRFLSTVYGIPSMDISGWTRPRSLNHRRRALILERDAFTCRRCGAKAPNVRLEVDHIEPRSDGGRDIPQNLQTLCHRCNAAKSDYNPTDHDLRAHLL